MKVWIDTDERYPDYLVLGHNGGDAYSAAIEVDEKTLARWEKAEADYNKRAAEIRAVLDARKAT